MVTGLGVSGALLMFSTIPFGLVILMGQVLFLGAAGTVRI